MSQRCAAPALSHPSAARGSTAAETSTRRSGGAWTVHRTSMHAACWVPVPPADAALGKRLLLAVGMPARASGTPTTSTLWQAAAALLGGHGSLCPSQHGMRLALALSQQSFRDS